MKTANPWETPSTLQLFFALQVRGGTGGTEEREREREKRRMDKITPEG